MLGATKSLLKQTPLYSLFFRFNHFRYYKLPVIKEGYKLWEDEWKRKYYYQYFPVKPKVVNLNANDICNSKCTMCNIWEQKQGHEVSPQELNATLSDPLFSEVTDIGITGGEPTLREDLPLLYEAAIKAIPGLRGLSIITNAIRKDDVINRVEKVIEICTRHGKGFSMMVSLDGYGKAHDNIRGREGNFESAMAVIDHFMSKGVNLAIGSTISKKNVWDAEELLYFLKKKNIYGRFRVAEFIKRLYNDDRSDVIRNFDEEEIYQLTLFFYKLIFTFEKNETYKRTYYSIIEVLNGHKRQIGCPYHADGVVLNSRGELAYCAPKSPIIGNTLKKSGWSLFKEQLKERRKILDENCDNCIHDYHFPLTYQEYKLQKTDKYWRNLVHLNNSQTIQRKSGPLPVNLSSTDVKAFIVGWYGTETVGDKAILGGIILDLQRKHGPSVSIVIGSLFPYITIKTVKELKINATVVPVYSPEFVDSASYCDITIMGGGPLMDLDELAVPLHAFRIARKNNKQAIVYGCGLGPLHFERNIAAVKEILSLSTEVMLRDAASITKSKEFSCSNAKLSGDFAKFYLENHSFPATKETSTRLLSCYLREWTHEYSRDLNQEGFESLKEKFEGGLAILLKEKAEEMNATEIRLQNMHNFVVGNDDRDFSRYFIEKYFTGYTFCPITYDEKLSTVDSIVDSMRASSHNICMRFHSVLFAHTLKVPFTAVDYTKGGKILNYLKDNESAEHLLSVEDLLKKTQVYS